MAASLRYFGVGLVCGFRGLRWCFLVNLVFVGLYNIHFTDWLAFVALAILLRVAGSVLWGRASVSLGFTGGLAGGLVVGFLVLGCLLGCGVYVRGVTLRLDIRWI